MSGKSDTTLTEGTIQTGTIIRSVVYNHKTGKFHALTGDPAADAAIREEAHRQSEHARDQ